LCLPSCITIGEDAFFDSALKRISLPAVKTIASGAFQLCDLLKTVLIPVVETIGSCAFRGCSDLEEIYISEGINLDDYFPIRTGKTKVMKIVSTIII
jgi:hypothetical protein